MIAKYLYDFLNEHYSLKAKAKLGCYLFNNPFKKHRLPAVAGGRCNICGKKTIFLDFSGSPETYFCYHCGSSARNRAIAKLMLMEVDPASESVKDMRQREEMDGYISSGYGALPQILKTKNFSVSEYFENVPTGPARDCIRCEDLTNLTFPDETFDIVISEHVLEHVNDPIRSFKEINRVLKKNGLYLFTIPFESIDETITRVFPDGRLIMRERFHIDPLRHKGALVYTEFSKSDIIEKFLKPSMFRAEILTLNDRASGIFSCDVIKARKIRNL